MAHARVVFATGLSLLLGVLSCALPARAGDLSMTLLPTVAQRVEVAKPQDSFEGKDLALAADAGSTPTKLVYLRFSLATVPEGATITGGTLRLSVLQGDQKWQLVRVFPVTFPSKLGPGPQPFLSWTARPAAVGPQAVGSAEARVAVPPAQEKPVDFELVKPDTGGWVKREKGEVALMLRSPSPSTEYTYRGLCPPATAASAPCANTQPRLIVRYSMERAPAIPWPQARYDAQQSGRTPWRLSANNVVADVVHRRLYTVSGNIGFSPALAQRTVILYTERDDKGSDKFFVTAVDEGGTERWSPVNIKAQSKFSPPVLDGRGRVWVVTENALHRIEVGDAGPSLVTHELATLLGPESVSVQAAPTVGANGAIYLSTNRGVLALTPDPDLRVWWRHAQSPPFGQVALSADEATAYVVSGAKASLVAIDNADGKVRWSKGPIDTPQDQSPLPVPAVGTAPDDTGKARTVVYLVSGYERGPSLHMFDGETGRAAVRVAESYSRPVVAGTGHVVVVVKEKGRPRGQLCRFFWWSAWDEKKATVLQKCQPDGPEDLSTLSVLAVDGHDNIYLIDPITNPQNPKQKVRGYTYDFAPLFTLGVDPTPSPPVGPSTTFGRNLAIGPGGTLFLTNANALFAIEPTKLHSSAPAVLTLGGSALQKMTATAFLAPRIRVAGDVTIGATQNLVLRSGAIGFQPGFKVLRGAEFQCKSWTPSP